MVALAAPTHAHHLNPDPDPGRLRRQLGSRWSRRSPSWWPPASAGAGAPPWRVPRRPRRPGPPRGFVGVPLIRDVPIDALRVVVGALFLVLGLAWLRKAILRASGHKALHDEDAIYAETVADLAARGPRAAAGSAAPRAGTAWPSPWPSRACSWRGPRWSSSWSASGPPSTGSAWPPWARRRPCWWSVSALWCPPSLRGAREHHQVRGRHHVDHLRRVLDRRRRRGATGPAATWPSSG